MLVILALYFTHTHTHTRLSASIIYQKTTPTVTMGTHAIFNKSKQTQITSLYFNSA